MQSYAKPPEPVPPHPTAASDPPALDPRRRRILFRATHRGTHETDVLIGGFVTPRIAGFSDAELDAIEELMELPDVDLADWLMGRLPIPPESDSPMLRAVQAAARSRSLEGMGR
ncbi:succinate dehydrogenase assembly factor 2 [Lichenicola sp.]|uniref:FAD assembly factor SdhE n=1 Tax=Lichenicola sp. TaxID=2804529 RepID=UPI003AFFC6D6